MRILFVTPMFPSKHNIQQGIFVWELAKALQLKGHDVRVVSIEPVLVWPFNLIRYYRRETACGDVPIYEPIIRYQVNQYPRSISLPWMHKYWAQELLAKINEAWPNWRPQIIHSHSLISGALIAANIFRDHIPHISTSHGGDTRDQIFRRWPLLKIKQLFSNGLTVVGVSDAVTDLLSPFVKNSGQLRCIHNGMDLAKLTHANIQLRQMFNSRKLILSVGNLLKLKGFDFLLKAFSELAEEFAMWDLAIVGGGREADDLKRLAEELKLHNRVYFTGPLPRTETMEWMDMCDVFCLPSWAEGFGVVYLEAMANGKPVIGVIGQGIDAIIRKHSTGLLVEPKDVQSLVAALRQLINNEAMRKEMGQKGKEVVLKEFTWSHCAQKYVQLYRDILVDETKENT